MGQTKRRFDGRITKEVSLDYLLYFPRGYGENIDQKWPLVLFLHGAGERGDDIEMVKKHGIPKLIEDGQDFPFICVSPQCKPTSFWPYELDGLKALLDNVIDSYLVDTERVYLTGLSMGGFGSWHLAEAYPDLFAAVAPICGGTLPMIGFPERIKKLKHVPLWVFHGAKDEVVPIKSSQDLVEALRDCDGNVQFTVYEEAGHDAWTETYKNPKLYEWMLKQRTPKS